MQQTKNIVIAA
jgi:hypothetical protein